MGRQVSNTVSTEKLCSHKGRLLQDHLLNVAIKTKEILNQALPSDCQYREIILNTGYLIGLTHDLGKSTQYFQDHLNEGEQGVLTHHSILSSMFTLHIVSTYLDKQNLPEDFKTILKALAMFTVKKHHSDLSEVTKALMQFDSDLIETQIQSIDNDKLQEVLDAVNISQWYTREINTDTLREWLKNLQSDQFLDLVLDTKHILYESDNLNYYFLSNILFSALVNADTVDAALETTIDIPDCLVQKSTIEQYQAKIATCKSEPLVMMRQQAYQEAINSIDQQIQQGLPNRLLTLTLPTGLGKTITSFAVANRMKTALGKQYKIIYAVPFINIIEQNADVFENLIKEQYSKEPTSDLLLLHYHLGDIYYKTDEADYDVQQSTALIETWNSSVIVTTFVQLMHTLISNSKSMLLKYNKLANSIIILDEAQALPLEYWKLISSMLSKTLEAFNSYAIVMTATKPLYFDGVPLVSNRYDTLNRYTIDTNTYIDVASMEQFINTFPIECDKTYLFVLNTIREAEIFYDLLQKRIPKEKVGFLSSHVIPKQRRETIKEAKEGNIQFLVSTQVVEAGVDLDFDVVVRDFAPMEAIVQSAGRCNRNGTKEGQVYITRFKDSSSYFAHYIYSDVLLQMTYSLIANRTIEEKDVKYIFDQYMQKVKYYKDTDTASDKLYESIIKLKYEDIYNFQVIKNETPQVDVFVEADEDASRIWRQAVEIMSIENALERKNRFKEMKKDFYNYVISVPVTTKLDKNMHVLR